MDKFLKFFDIDTFWEKLRAAAFFFLFMAIMSLDSPDIRWPIAFTLESAIFGFYSFAAWISMLSRKEEERRAAKKKAAKEASRKRYLIDWEYD